MKKKIMIGVVAALIVAGAFVQEYVCRGGGAAKATSARELGRALSRSVASLCAKGSALEWRKESGGRARAPDGRLPEGTVLLTNSLAEGSAEQLRYINHAQVLGVGEAVVILEDSPDASSCQKFMLRLESGKILLVEHNTQIAPRVQGLELGDEVEVCGQYTYDMDGDVIRRTHKDPAGRHAAGWVRHKGRTYQ